MKTTASQSRRARPSYAHQVWEDRHPFTIRLETEAMDRLKNHRAKRQDAERRVVTMNECIWRLIMDAAQRTTGPRKALRRVPGADRHMLTVRLDDAARSALLALRARWKTADRTPSRNECIWRLIMELR